MTTIPFIELPEVAYGSVTRLSPLIRRVVADNPSKYTYRGTGTYIVGEGTVAVIDPGPLLDAHLDALLLAVAGERVAAILVTHCHADHSPLAAQLAQITGAPTYGFGPVPVYPPELVDDDLDDDATVGEPVEREAVDHDFDPDVSLADGSVIGGPGWTFEALHTPGHASNHMCYALAEEEAVFTGDHVMGWSTTVIAPPDGTMGAYLDSLDRLRRRSPRILYPTHGAPIVAPAPFLEAYRAHRVDREVAILDLVRTGIADIPTMVSILYADVREELHRAAGRSVLAHLIKLVGDGRVTVAGGGPPRAKARFVAV